MHFNLQQPKIYQLSPQHGSYGGVQFPCPGPQIAGASFFLQHAELPWKQPFLRWGVQSLLQKCGNFCSSWLTASFPLKYNLPVLVLGFRIGLCGVRLGESTEAAGVV